jgi:hypothetical protein
VVATINPLGDFGSTIEDILVDLNEPTTTAAKDRIRRFICRCGERHRAERFRWMRSQWRLVLRAGVGTYDLRTAFDVPLRTIEGKYIRNLQTGTGDVPVYDITRQDMETVMGRRVRENLYRGTPRIFAVEGGRLELDPAPDTDGDILQGRGFKIVPGPERWQTGGTWSFSPDSFTSEWFTDGSELVNSWVRYKMYVGPLRNHDDAATAAGEYEEIKAAMRMETEDEEAPTETVPYFPM